MTRRILLPSLALGASILFSQAQDAKIDTVAGNGEIGFFGDGGRALEAALHQPFGVVVSPAGDIVFCDTNNHVIRRISRKKRTIETIVGTGEKGWSGDGGPPSEAKLNEPVRNSISSFRRFVLGRENVAHRSQARCTNEYCFDNRGHGRSRFFR